MDIEKYVAGKANGISGVELQGDSTLLVKWPDGFDATTGAPNPPKEQGYQPADIAAMKQSAIDAVAAAQSALAEAEQRADLFNILMADVAVYVPQIEANLKAVAERAASAQTTGTIELSSARQV